MRILDRINSPADLQSLNNQELTELCGEIREFLIDKVSKTGGHLASNLGVVELTVAIHLVFNTAVDRLVFDVGHQSYVHKMLTGRRDGFDRLRKFGGISGFPKPTESIHDAFIAGHASNSISIALGMARARTKLGEDKSVIALIGDGALTGGMAYEALEDAGDSNEPLIVILNNNGMSIEQSVGGVSHDLARMRMRPGYINFKSNYRRFLMKVPGGKTIHNALHKIKTSIKNIIFHSSIFEEMGFEYLGPVDGHNIKEVTAALRIAKSLKCPVLVHVITEKGHGCEYTENNPERYHGVPRFDPKTGEISEGLPRFSDIFGEKMTELAKKDSGVVAITAAMESGTGLTEFANVFPERFYDTGITECHSASMCAGMASQGLKPVFAVYSTFLQRAYDMLLHEVALSKSHVVFGVDRAGLVGDDGETHHGVFDVGYLASVPGMEILCPSGFQELRDMLEYAVLKAECPVAVRYPRGTEGKYKSGGTDKSKVLCKGRDITIVSYGMNINDALEAADILQKKKISAQVIKLGFIKPIEFKDIIESVKVTGRLMVVEECAESGCVGERIAAELLRRGINVKSLLLKNLGSGIVPSGTIKELQELCGIDSVSLAESVMEVIANG